MMKFAGKVFLLMVVMTSSMVLYVHGQVAIFRVSYDLNVKSDMVREKSEEYRRIKYEVEKMKAPVLLEETMKEMDMELALPREIQVVALPKATLAEVPGFTETLPRQLNTGRLDFLGRWIKVAQAKMEQ